MLIHFVYGRLQKQHLHIARARQTCAPASVKAFLVLVLNRLFHTLGSVQMVDGMAKMGDGQFERTLFTSGYSSKTNTYYMNTYDDPAIRSYAMADYDMDSSELISVAR